MNRVIGQPSGSDPSGDEPSGSDGEDGSRDASSSELELIVRGLEADLRRQKRARTLRGLASLGVVVILLGGFFLYRRSTAPPPEPRFVLAPVERRDVVERVQATGIVEPVNKVEVGSQVSGRVATVRVDFNDRVSKGQLLAEIDPEIFSADVVQSRAQLDAAQAALARSLAARDAALVRRDRLRSLVAEAAASAAEFDTAQADLNVSEAEVTSARAQISQLSARVESARATLKYTKIFSPIDGVVIDRKVEPGQTVAASFNTPVLFVIAKDLRQMRVLAEIDEADVGKVHEGMQVDIVVDAFPEDHFEGSLTQIRLSPSTAEGVVTYAAVVLVDNAEGKLRPGMTASATVETRAERGVPTVRNAALRFEPLPEPTRPGSGQPGAGQPGAGKPAGAGPVLPKPLVPGEGKVYLVEGGPPEAPRYGSRTIQIGITDGAYTMVKGGLDEHASVIIDERPSETRRGFRLF